MKSNMAAAWHVAIPYAVILPILITMLPWIRSVSSTTAADFDCPTGNVGFWLPFKEEYFIQENASICEVPDCPEECFCTLGNNTVKATCPSLPTSVGKLIYPKDVVILYLANISLNEVEPYAFVDVPSIIRELYLNNNTFTELLPGVFEGLSNLEFLYLYLSEIQVIHPGVFDGLTSLIFLDLIGNHLEVLSPYTFRGLHQLEELDLEENQLKELYPGAFHGLTSLTALDLDWNQINELKPGLFDGLIALEELDLDNNYIVKVHLNVFRDLAALTELDLDLNRIEELQPGVFTGLDRLDEIELDNNYLKHLPTGLFNGVPTITRLSVAHNQITTIDPEILSGLSELLELHLSHNAFSGFHPSLFQKVKNLEILYMDNNYIQDMHPDLLLNLKHLEAISLAGNQLQTLPNKLFRDQPALRVLNISGNQLDRLVPQVFQQFDRMVTLDLTKNPLMWITSKLFDVFPKQTTVFVDSYATCCFIQSARCIYQSARSPFISCKRILPYSLLRVVVWLIGITIIVGNMFVLYTRCRQRTSRGYVQFLLITNLSLSDLLMGIYMLILTSADLRFADFFPSHSESWRQSMLCKFAGVLSMISSEGSVFFITLISLDRFLGVTFPFANVGLRRTSAKVVVTATWCLATVLSIISILIPIVNPSLYDVSEVCVGLPISRTNVYVTVTKPVYINTSSFEQNLIFGEAKESIFVGSQSTMYYSIAIFTGLNLLCFIVVALCYIAIFITAKQTSQQAGRSANLDEEIRMAVKMSGIVLTDFCCWMLVVVLSILVQTKVVTLNPAVYAWIVTFLMPINSCINPFLYTLSTVISDRLQSKNNGAGLHMSNTKSSSAGTNSVYDKSEVNPSYNA